MTILSDILEAEIQQLRFTGYANSIELKIYQAIQALSVDQELKHQEEMALLRKIYQQLVGPETGDFNPQTATISSS
jgi:hypothetical protein